MTSTTALPLSSRVYAVTGGASGIGAATVHELARKGAAAIWVGDWNTSNFDIIKQQVNDISPTTKIYTHKLDVSKPQDVNAWVDDIVRESGALHGAANVAGVPQTPIGLRQGSLKPTILSQDDDEWNHVLDVNLNGVFYCTRAEARAMVGMPSNIDRAIVNVASMASIVHIPGVFAYCVSKAGVAHFSVQVANDVKPFGVRCNVISPGKSINIRKASRLH